MIERIGSLLADLRPPGRPPTPREVAELIWLARVLPERTGDRTAPAGPRGPAPAAPDGRPPPRRPPQDGDPVEQEPGATRLYLPGDDADGAGDTAAADRATPVRVAGPATLPRRREVARALRPFKRRVPSTVRTVLDEDATAGRIADHHHWMPVLAPAADRWLDALIVLDSYQGGATFWEPLGRELLTLLQRLGAFRDVRMLHLLARDDGRPGLAVGSGTPSPLLRPTSSAIDPTGRTLTFLLTDGVAPGWRTGPLQSALREWADSGPTAILQALPEHVWEQTALAPQRGRFRNTEAGGPNSRLLYTGYGLRPRPLDRGGVAVPVLAATPEWLGPWAQAVAGPGAFDGAAVLLPAAAHTPQDPLAAPERHVSFEDFRARAQPDVFRLAGYLAAAPLNLAVMRTVQSAMLPDSPPSDLAEIVFSGLLHRMGGGTATDDALSRAYEFVPGMRERLLGTIRRDEADEVIAAVSAYVDRHAPATGARFTAAIADPDGPLTLPVGARHWAEVHNLVRRRQGRPVAPRTARAESQDAAVEVRTVPVEVVTEPPAVESADGPIAPDGPDPVGRRFLITIAVSRYADQALGELPAVRDDVERIRRLFEGMGYTHALPRLGDNPTAAEVLRHLGEWSEQTALGPTDVVAVYFAGLATTSGRDAQLLMADSRLDDLSGAARPEDLCGRLLGRGAALLLLLDTCYDQANGLRRPRFGWSENFPPGDSDVFALTCSASRDADARFYSRALTHVIVTAEASTTARYLSLDMVGHGLNAYAQDVTDSPDRELTFHTHSDETRRNRFFPNPRYLADDLAPFVLRPATSAGGDSNALNALTSWLRPPDGDGGGLLVVTGGPGSGKTSLLRRLVAFADPARAAEFAEQAMYWPAAYGQVVALRANRATLADLRGALAARLDVPLTGDDGPQDLRSQPDTPVLVVIDALDKTRGGPEEGEAAIRELLLPLARRSRIRVVAATRPELLPAFVPRPEIVDLDALQYRVPDAELYLFETLRRYPRRPADGSPVGPHGAPDKAHRWSRTIAERIGQSATMARFLARRALEAFVGDWVTVDDFLQRELPAALDAYTDTFGNDRQEAGQLLRALAYAQGDGFPSTSEWAAVAAAVTREPVTAVDIDRYLARSDGLVLTLWSPSDNSMRYRLPHPSVAEVLRVGDDPRQVHADIAASLASRLLGAGESAFDFPDRPLASEYAEEHLATHAAAGGTLDDYLTDPAFVRRSSPRTLGAVLDSWRSPLARAVEETLRAATVPPGCSDAEAHDILALSALMLGHSSLAEKYAGAAGWTPAWAAPDIPAVSLGSAVLDGRDLVVAGAKDGSVWLLDPGSGSRVTGIQRDADPVTAVSCVSIDGRPHAVASAQDGTVSVWDLIAGSLRTATVSPAGPVPAVACTTVEGRPFAVYCRTERAGSTVYLWDLVTGVTASTFTTDAAATSTLACATVDGTPYAVLAAGRSVSLWNLREPQPGGEEQQDAAVTAVACGSARDTPIAFLGLEDGSVHTQYFNGLSARVTRRRKHSSPVVAVVTGMLDGRLFGVSSDAEGVTHVCETARPGSPVWSLRLPRRATALHFAAGRLTIAMDGPLIAVDLRARR